MKMLQVLLVMGVVLVTSVLTTFGLLSEDAAIAANESKSLLLLSVTAMIGIATGASVGFISLTPLRGGWRTLSVIGSVVGGLILFAFAFARDEWMIWMPISIIGIAAGMLAVYSVWWILNEIAKWMTVKRAIVGLLAICVALGILFVTGLFDDPEPIIIASESTVEDETDEAEASPGPVQLTVEFEYDESATYTIQLVPNPTGCGLVPNFRPWHNTDIVLYNAMFEEATNNGFTGNWDDRHILHQWYGFSAEILSNGEVRVFLCDSQSQLGRVAPSSVRPPLPPPEPAAEEEAEPDDEEPIVPTFEGFVRGGLMKFPCTDNGLAEYKARLADFCRGADSPCRLRPLHERFADIQESCGAKFFPRTLWDEWTDGPIDYQVNWQ